MDIGLGVDDGFATVVLNRPQHHHAHDPQHGEALSEAWMRGLLTGLRMDPFVNRNLQATQDVQQGRAASAKKRAPEFKGR